MRLSASRIRSINRRLARAQGISRPAHNLNRHISASSTACTSTSLNRITPLKIVAVPRSMAA